MDFIKRDLKEKNILNAKLLIEDNYLLLLIYLRIVNILGVFLADAFYLMKVTT